MSLSPLRAATSTSSVVEPESVWLHVLRTRLVTITDQLLAALLRPQPTT
ncbi:MAG: hypothetical protein ABJA74_17120 [Lapillicoccus sp.]